MPKMKKKSAGSVVKRTSKKSYSASSIKKKVRKTKYGKHVYKGDPLQC